MQYVEPFKDPEAARRYIRARVAITDAGCWEWQRSTKPEGYGSAHIESRTLPAHRASLLAEGAQMPLLHPVDHLCRNRACVNPEHLEAVTVSVNAQRGANVISRRGKPTGCRKHGLVDGRAHYWNHGNVAWNCFVCDRERKEKKAHEEA